MNTCRNLQGFFNESQRDTNCGPNPYVIVTGSTRSARIFERLACWGI